METRSLGLLLLRLSLGGMLLVGHGWSKLLGFADKMDHFPDPLGVGSSVSLGLVVLAEVLCTAAVMIGFKTRQAVLPIIGFSLVAAFVFHGDDPFAKRELALVYGAWATTLLFTGPGRYSLDEQL